MGNCTFVQLEILLLCTLSVVVTYLYSTMYRAADNHLSNQAMATIAVPIVSSLREI